MLRLQYDEISSYETVSDIAGEVVEVGPEVKSVKAGDKVVSILTATVSSFA